MGREGLAGPGVVDDASAETGSAGIVSALDGAIVEVYVGARVRQQDAEREVRRTGLWVRDPRTGKVRRSPAARVATSSARTAGMVGRRLGIAPSGETS